MLSLAVCKNAHCGERKLTYHANPKLTVILLINLFSWNFLEAEFKSKHYSLYLLLMMKPY